MPSAKRQFSKKSTIRYWLARELKREIPELDLYGQERSLLDFAYHDLETSLKTKWKDTNSEELEEALKPFARIPLTRRRSLTKSYTD